MDWRLNSQRPQFAQTIDRAMEATQLDDEEHAASRRRSVSWSEAKYPGCHAPLGDSEADWCANGSSRHHRLHRRFIRSTIHQSDSALWLRDHAVRAQGHRTVNDPSDVNDRCTRTQLARCQGLVTLLPSIDQQLRGVP